MNILSVFYICVTSASCLIGFCLGDYIGESIKKARKEAIERSKVNQILKDSPYFKKGFCDEYRSIFVSNPDEPIS